jgi:uncharacterized protein
MHINSIDQSNFNTIDGYGDGFLIIDEKKIFNDIIISKNQLLEVNIKNLESVKWQKVVELTQDTIDTILIGTGKSHQILSDDIKKNIKEFFPNSTISEMQNQAACRTYNILITENRNVMAIIFQSFN